MQINKNSLNRQRRHASIDVTPTDSDDSKPGHIRLKVPEMYDDYLVRSDGKHRFMKGNIKNFFSKKFRKQ